MKRYRFRLESVLRVRRIEEDRAAQQLAESRRAEAAALERQHAAESAYARRGDQRRQQAAASFLANRVLADAGAATVILARKRHATAVELVDTRRDEWTAAAGRVTGLERLDERGRDAHRREDQRVEAIAVDDLVTGRHGRAEEGRP